ncbi:ubiquitin carboxyl-terminal hydrolase [Mrakia frigida]|uniref:ubiquitin carboxyl-terminal hydrolase n=1 Tax=Mrakia frigida TaxID=29902 RepID=UPI003FCC056A
MSSSISFLLSNPTTSTWNPSLFPYPFFRHLLEAMSDDNAGWSLTESDPSVFTALLSGLGVQGLQVEDLYTLDEEATAGLGEIKALIFLFKYVNGIEESTRAGELDRNFPGVFINQVITNACGSLAILNAVLNFPPSSSSSEDNKLVLGEELENLKSFTEGMDSMDKGHVISNSQKLREVHNSFARSDPFTIDPSLSDANKEKEDAYHFVAYLPVAGSLYELDGLQPAPRRHGAVKEGSGWMEEARKVVRERIESYPMGALHFSLLAITADPMPAIQRELKEAHEKGDEGAAAQAMMRLDDEERKRKQWAFENSLRRHNHISFIHALLLGLASSAPGALDSAVEDARKKGKERREAAAERRKNAKASGGDDDEMEE